MKNVEMTVEGTVLTIKVDLSMEFGPSASGKTTIRRLRRLRRRWRQAAKQLGRQRGPRQ